MSRLRAAVAILIRRDASSGQDHTLVRALLEQVRSRESGTGSFGEGTEAGPLLKIES